MSKKQKFLINLGLLLALAVSLFLVFTFANDQPTWVQMLLAAVLAGLYGASQTYLRNK